MAVPERLSDKVGGFLIAPAVPETWFSFRLRLKPGVLCICDLQVMRWEGAGGAQLRPGTPEVVGGPCVL